MGSNPKKRALGVKDRARIGPSHHGTKEQPNSMIFRSCLKVTQDLSKEIARYSSLVIGLGGSQDCQILRDELRLIRLKSYNLARQNMDTLTPFLQRRKEPIDTEHTEVDKLLRLFVSTVEIFLPHLIKTIYLLAEFSLRNPSQESRLINTGITEPLMGLRSTPALLTTSSVRQLNEVEERKLVERQVSELECIVKQIDQNIDHRPWESPLFEDIQDNYSNATRNYRGDSTISFIQEVSSCSLFTCCSLQRPHRWFQIVIMTGLVVLVLSGCIVGIYCSSVAC